MKLIILITIASTLTRANPLLCKCGLGSGEDICSHNPKKCQPLVVRPVELPKLSLSNLPKPKIVCAPVGGIPPLIPIPGPCSCHSALVKPAIVPKPTCTTCCNLHQQQQQIQSINQHKSSCNSQILFRQPSNRPIFVDDLVAQPQNPAQLAPADAVSLAVAYNLAQKSCKKQEGQLAFGFRTLPKEQPQIKRVTNNIPEENLYGLNGQIVELKKLTCGNTKTVEEEAIEDLLELAAEEEEARQEEKSLRKLTLGEIGYGPAKIKAAPFINVPLANPLLAVEEKLLEAGQCNDGFQPGNVIIKEIPKFQPILDVPVPLPEPCPPEKEFEIPSPPSAPLPCPCAGYPVQFVSSSSCSSSCNQQQNQFTSGTFLQKLGSCDV